MGTRYLPEERRWVIEPDDDDVGEDQGVDWRTAAVKHALGRIRPTGRPRRGDRARVEKTFAGRLVVGDEAAHATLSFAARHCGLKTPARAIAAVWDAVVDAQVEGIERPDPEAEV